MRRLVVTGKDCTGADALYDLLGHLHVQSIPNSFFVKAATFAKLILFRGISIGKAASVFHTVKLEPMEKGCFPWYAIKPFPLRSLSCVRKWQDNSEERG